MTPTRPGSPSPASSVPIPGEIGRAGYFEAVYRASLTALSHGEQRFLLKVAGNGLTLRFANPGLAEALLPALAHLLAGSESAEAARICVWDSRTTGVAVPPPPWQPEDYLSRGDIRGWSTGIHAAFNLGAGTLSLYDVESSTGIFWIHDVASLPSWERAAPLRTILGWFLRSRSVEMLHAGAIGYPSGGVLLAGRGGRGKSTVCLGAITSSDLRYAGDDYVAVSLDPGPEVQSIYNSGKLELVHARERLPALAALATRLGGEQQEKGMLLVHRHFPDRIVTRFPIRAVLLPEIGARQPSTLQRISPLSVLQELVPTTMSQMPGTDSGTFRTLASVVKAVPCYRLGVGPDLAATVGAIRNLLAPAP